ncbi:uncharacterized protein [Salminus brasiliensis]|uniref:uncharacterized protein n=1 Tax=Salminus brasiliensis TaxID=930266 RepID=UPI003B834411
MPGVDFQSQISSIMEMLANAAVAEICKVIEDGCAVLQLEISQSLKENEYLRRRVSVMERALLPTERETAASGGFSQLKRPAVSSRIEHRSTDQHGAGSIKDELVDLENEADVLIVKEEKLQTVCGDVSCSVQASVRSDLCRTERVCIADAAAFPSEEPNYETEKCRRSSEEVEPAVSAESTGQNVTVINTVDTIENGVDQTEAIVSMDTNTACEGAETAGSGFDQHLEFLSAQQSCSNTVVKPDFLTVEPGPAEEELDGLGACLQRGSDELVSTRRELQHRHGASEQHILGFVDSLSGTSLDHVPWICHPQGHSNQTHSGPQNLRGDAPLDCGVCGQSFSHVRQLKHHERVHTEEKVFRCGRCGRQFPQLCRLKRHERVHTGEKPFRCARCGKHFAQANNLKVHQSVHTGERRFSCAQCGKNFSFLSNLIRHKAVHTGK